MTADAALAVPLPVVAVPPARPARTATGIPNAVLGTALFLFTEAMMFAGLISAHIVLRSGFTNWPPLGQPRLPVGVTAVATALLVLSGLALGHGTAVARGYRHTALGTGSWRSELSGRLVVQPVRRIGRSLHAIVGVPRHVIAAVLVLVVVRRWRAGLSAAGLTTARMYWWFVVAVWPVLYACCTCGSVLCAAFTGGWLLWGYYAATLFMLAVPAVGGALMVRFAGRLSVPRQLP